METHPALLESPEIQATHEAELDRLLVERYIPGAEVAVEGLLTRGKLRILAIFDKPDPLEGPYFEETIYVTPSRLPERDARRASRIARRRRFGRWASTHGPVHAEFRVNEHGPWVLEASPRPIGGLCSRALRFGPERILLEELLVRHALGMPGSELDREDGCFRRHDDSRAEIGSPGARRGRRTGPRDARRRRRANHGAPA